MRMERRLKRQRGVRIERQSHPDRNGRGESSRALCNQCSNRSLVFSTPGSPAAKLRLSACWSSSFSCQRSCGRRARAPGYGCLVILQGAGIDLTSLNVLVGAIGVGLGFGLQAVTSNFFSGLIILFERPIKIGQRIEIDGVVGQVREIAARATTPSPMRTSP
jgi:hypothetical protein